MILDILKIGSVQGVEDEVGDNSGEERLRSFSKSLPYLFLLWQCVKVDPKNPDKETINMERFVRISVILKRVNLLYTLLCNREFSRRDRGDKEVGEPRQGQLLYARHSHQHEKPCFEG